MFVIWTPKIFHLILIFKKRDTGGTDPKTTALTTLGLSMGAKENLLSNENMRFS